ncbi:response regulator transcription factor [Actinocorallia longicatena]|uniref:Response regulator transcription factor n=1 Tax=Actinocorallia longicatena TaxID=111803 RepID=A0ABP6QK02_9ACTN
MDAIGARIIVAEDDPGQAELVRRYLERDGHDVVVVHDGSAALSEFFRRAPDLLVLDVMMPQVDGLDVCREIRRTSEIPVVMLTARSTEADVLLGLDLGADDYLVKPFSPRELAARVRTVLRRSRPREVVTRRMNAGDLVLDLDRHEVTRAGAPIEVTPAEFRLLTVLAGTPGRVYTRSQLLEHVTGMGKYITERTIDAHMRNLRKKVERDPHRPALLVTVYGVGYKFADV